MAYVNRTKLVAKVARPKVIRRGYPAAVFSSVDYAIHNKIQSGASVPNYKELIRTGQNASSDYTMSATRLVSSTEARHSYTWRDYFGTIVATNSFDGFADPIQSVVTHRGIDTATVKAAALAKAYKRLREAQQHVASPSIIAEILDVLRQFGRPMRSVVDLSNRHLNKVELAKKGIMGSASWKRIKYREILADLYLEWSFGLSPLINDTKLLAEAFRRHQHELEYGVNPSFRSLIRTRSQATSALPTVTSSILGSVDYHYKRNEIHISEFGMQYIASVQATHSAEFGSNERLLQLLGFDHANWIPAAWEAIPWSWLLDYFLNIQQILEAGVTSQAGVKWVVETERTKSRLSTNFVFDLAATAGTLSGAGRSILSSQGSFGGFVVETVAVKRKALSTLPVPPLITKHPFGSPKKVLNMVAVLLAREPSSSKIWFS